MTSLEPPLRIEIIDPRVDPPPGRATAVTATPGRSTTREAAPAAWSAASADETSVADPLRHLHRVGDGLARMAWWLGHRRMLLAANGDPRRNSTIRRHVFVPFDGVCRGLPREGTVVAAGGARLALTSDFEARDGRHRASADLRLVGSWPALPVWVTAEPWWRDRSVVTLELRSSRRWRYPRRYFSAALAVLQRLVADPG